MKYDFSTLSPDDFEDLSRDLVGAELGVRFEAFTAGTDEGMDGRHAKADGSIILQAKHYFRSGLTKLKSKMRDERASIDGLAPQRYILTTSVALTPANKATLADIVGPALLSPGDSDRGRSSGHGSRRCAGSAGEVDASRFVSAGR